MAVSLAPIRAVIIDVITKVFGVMVSDGSIRHSTWDNNQLVVSPTHAYSFLTPRGGNGIPSLGFDDSCCWAAAATT